MIPQWGGDFNPADRQNQLSSHTDLLPFQVGIIGERQNLAEKYSERVEAMQQAIAKWLKEVTPA